MMVHRVHQGSEWIEPGCKKAIFFIFVFVSGGVVERHCCVILPHQARRRFHTKLEVALV
jgi:hypothetical protein